MREELGLDFLLFDSIISDINGKSSCENCGNSNYQKENNNFSPAFSPFSSSALQIWGIGNVLLGDDAVGPLIASRVGGTDCGTTPENYIAKLRRNPPKALVIIDAADMGLEPGETRLISFEEMRGAAMTSHGMPLSLLLEPFSRDIAIFMIGIQPQQTELGQPLSECVSKAADTVSAMLNDYQVKFSPK